MNVSRSRLGSVKTLQARFLFVWLILVPSAALSGCSDGSDGSDESGCRGSCPAEADYLDASAACGELGHGKAYCYSEDGDDYAVNCVNDGYSSELCFRKPCKVDDEGTVAACE